MDTLDIDQTILDDIIIDFDQDDAAWDELIEKILQGDVIPVICPSIQWDKGNIHQRLVDICAKHYKVTSNPSSFSELIYDPSYINHTNNNKKVIYSITKQILSQIQFPPSRLLVDLLNIKQFPFVITTSFTPIVENAMRDIWGEELRVMKFDNNPSEIQDIISSADMRKPTVYYMFGKVGDMARRYVLTDTDMLEFCTSWVADAGYRPKNLVNELKEKYLLVLGNDYSDWLFRFIWYSFRISKGKDTEEAKASCYAYDTVEDTLSHFLQRHNTFMRQNPTEFVQQIKERLGKKLRNKEQTKFDAVENNADIFISYSRSDAEVAEKLYEELTAMGKRVWYDRKNISVGGNFMAEIRKGIRTARYFIPILSHHIEQEKNDSHVYRQEWDEAIQQSISLGRRYIIPVYESGFDFYKANIPEKMQQHNAIEFTTSGDMHDVAKQIIHTMNLE